MTSSSIIYGLLTRIYDSTNCEYYITCAHHRC